MPISATNYDGSLNYSVAEMKDLCKPNLLDNADFRFGAINQKGESTYIADSTLKYTIDRWGTIETGSSVGVGSNFISVVGSFYQMIDIIKKDQTDMTFTIKRSGDATKSITFDASKISSGVDKTIKVDDNITFGIFFQDGKNKAWVYISTNANVNIDYMKLEEGPNFTGLPAYDSSKEWFNCRRKYKKLKVLAHSISYTDTGFWYNISISDGIPMAKKPSLSNYGKSGCVFTWGASPIEDLSISTIEDFDELTNMPLRIGLNKETSMVYPTLEVLLELDANDYL